MNSAPLLDVVGCNASCSPSVVSPQDQDGLSVSPPRWGRLSPSLETEVEPVENPVDRTTTVAALLQREPQVFRSISHGNGTGAHLGTFNLTRQDEADEMIRRITAMREFLKPNEEAAN